VRDAVCREPVSEAGSRINGNKSGNQQGGSCFGDPQSQKAAKFSAIGESLAPE